MYGMRRASAHGISQTVRPYPVTRSVCRCSGDALRASLRLWVLRCRALLCCSSTVPRFGCRSCFMYLQEGSIARKYLHHAAPGRRRVIRACICGL